jgi:hypothetical protein
MTVKQQLQEILDRLPDDCSFEDVYYRLYVVETIRKRAEMADQGDFAPQAEVEQRLSKWLAK